MAEKLLTGYKFLSPIHPVPAYYDPYNSKDEFAVTPQTQQLDKIFQNFMEIKMKVQLVDGSRDGSETFNESQLFSPGAMPPDLCEFGDDFSNMQINSTQYGIMLNNMKS